MNHIATRKIANRPYISDLNNDGPVWITTQCQSSLKKYVLPWLWSKDALITLVGWNK